MTGIVGAAGGIGGFLLPIVLGTLKQTTQSFSGGFVAFAFGALACAIGMAHVGRAWEREFLGEGGRRPDRPGEPGVELARRMSPPQRPGPVSTRASRPGYTIRSVRRATRSAER